MNQSKTKKALMMSILSMVLCVALLSGMTFAWFTDNDSTDVSVIQTGTLTVELQKKTGDGEENWTAVDGDALEFQPEDSRTEILWEPNAEYTLPTLRVENKGNLALKYKLEFTSADGDIELADVLEVKVNDIPLTDSLGDLLTGEADNEAITSGTLPAGAASEEINISIRMKEDASAVYAGKTITGLKIKVFATQDTAEYDSYGNTYDKDAAYYDLWDGTVAPAAYLAAVTDETAKTVKIDSAELLAAFARSVNDGKNYAGYTVTLEKDIDLNNVDWTPIGNTDTYCTPGASLNADLHHPFSGTFDGKGHTIANLKCNGGVANPTDPAATCQGLFGCLFAQKNSPTVKNLNIHNADIYALNSAGAFVGCFDTEQSAAYLAGMVSIENANLTGKVTIKGGNSGSVAGSPVGHWALYTHLEQVKVDVAKGSYVSNVDVAESGGKAAGGVMGGVVSTSAYGPGSSTIRSNIDLIAKQGNVGGIVGLTKGTWSNMEWTGDVTIKSLSPEARLTYGKIAGSWAPNLGKPDLGEGGTIANGDFIIEHTDGTVGEITELVGPSAW